MQAQLRTQGILVRHFMMPPTEHFLRVSIGTDEEMERFVEAYEVILKQMIGSTS
ncbi:histidinol-phosphate aminotransferase [Paenibacillus alvei]|uniref:histidinol-phosphate aminotransferase n=1 Tax=Paenibacillus alvei TaxID=44250 RepID=UPI000385FA0F|nr:histidinol-phosphate aminotransferase [Paenibacillus alvei]EPY13498.1 histidinol-phosphate aminotransferase [Paenibacillus alvei A6-6i-x]